MQVVSKFMMLHVAVNDMPKAKEFYAGNLGLQVIKDYRQDDENWWVELGLPEGGVHITLTTHEGHMKPGTLTLYFGTPDIIAAHKAMSEKGVNASEVQPDLHGPRSGTKWFNFRDPDDNLVHIEQL
jgi:catechol 2,3-dioxygenase-like lactoylglutathione lyase family enzyme